MKNNTNIVALILRQGAMEYRLRSMINKAYIKGKESHRSDVVRVLHNELVMVLKDTPPMIPLLVS